MDKLKKMGLRLCLWGGVCLVLAAAVLLTGWLLSVEDSQQKAADRVESLRSLIPTPQGALPEARRDNTMAVLSLEGTDFIGILEMPKYGSSLPVCAQWGQADTFPSRLRGSAYDRTLQIGATSQAGQYDFYREISVGDDLFFTDVEGNRFSYTVADIRYESTADQSTLTSRPADLVLFIQNVYGLDYILLFCRTA